MNQNGRPHGTMVRAAVQRSDDPCIVGSDPLLDVGACPSDETV
jgi:hypothetical protein